MSHRAGACALFLGLQALYVLTSTGRLHVTDEASAFFQARDLVETGALTVPPSTAGFAFYGQRDRAGRLRAPNGPLHAIALAPYYLLGRLAARGPGVPASSRDLVLACVVVISSATWSALAAALVLTLLVRRDTPPRAAVTASLALALGTPLFAYSGWLFSEPLAACLLIGAALCAFGDPGAVSASAAARAGALVGACLLVRPAHAMAAPVFMAAILVRDGRRGVSAALALGGAAAIAAAMYLAWNHHLFGDPFDFGYPPIADRGKRINGFDTPLVRGLAGFLLSPGKSVFVYAPLAALAITALPALARVDRGLAGLAIGMPVAYLFLYARYTQWEGGYCVGPRYLVPALPFLLIALAPYLAGGGRAARRKTLLLAAAGAIVQTVTLATSFLEDQFAGGYYDEGFNYRMAYPGVFSQGALLAHYVGAFVRGQPPAPLGTGFDRWFVFLGKAGVSWFPMAAATGLSVIAGAYGAFRLRRFTHVGIPAS